jgi:hypothetical protein
MAQVYLPFAQTLHDEQGPVGHLGRGTHYSVLRVPSFLETNGVPAEVALDQDLAVIWDEDHDARIMAVVEKLYRERLLHPVLFIGERKGQLTVIIAPEFSREIAWYSTCVESIADQNEGDPWTCEVIPYGSASGIISANDDDIATYLKNINTLWRLGTNRPAPPERPTGIAAAIAEVTPSRPLSREAFRQVSMRAWIAACRSILGASNPERMVWTALDDIVRVLRIVARDHNCNHLHYSDEGGEDLLGVEFAAEPDCLALITDDDSSADIVCPARLTFEHFPWHIESSYFRLELAPLKPRSRRRTDRVKEDLTEVKPGEYLEYDVWNRGNLGVDANGDEIPLPRGARYVSRYFKGPFIIVAKASPFNDRPYDDLHVTRKAEDFRGVVESIAIESALRSRDPRVRA